MSKRTERALEILAAGGYFRKQLETQYRGGEKFVTRLLDAQGQIVAGVGAATFYELESRLQWRETARSSVWPTEHVLRRVAETS